MDLLDPATLPVFLVYVMAAVLMLLVPVARRRRLHVGHAMAVLMLFVGFSRIFFFDYTYEVFGEGSFYMGHMIRGSIPGLNPLYEIGINPPAIFSLFYFTTNVVRLDPVVSLKVVRLLLGSLDVLLVYLIGRRLFPEPKLAFAAALLFAWAEIQLSLFEGDQFKNLLGHTFFLAFVLVAMDWLDSLGTGQPGQGRRLVTVITLGLGMILSHLVYAHVLAGVVGLTSVGFGVSVGAQKLLGRRPGIWLAVVLIGVTGFGYAVWFREFLPHVGAEGLVKVSELDYGFLTPVDEIRRPGILLYNIWILLATVGALMCARREGDRKSRAFLLTLFGFFTVLAKQYLVGLLLQPARFLMIDGPFLCLFAVYALWRISARVTGLGDRLLWIGVGLLVLANLAVMESGAAKLDLTRGAFRVSVGDVPEFLFGGHAPDRQLWLLLILSVVIVAAVYRAFRETRRGGQENVGLAGFLFVTAALLGVALGAVWLVEPAALHGVGQQLIALLFPMWALGWIPWLAIEPVRDRDWGVMRLTMVPVTSLLVFVCLWYFVLTGGGWGIGVGTHWSTTLTFLAPLGSLVALAGTTRLGARWRA